MPYRNHWRKFDSLALVLAARSVHADCRYPSTIFLFPLFRWLIFLRVPLLALAVIGFALAR